MRSHSHRIPGRARLVAAALVVSLWPALAMAQTALVQGLWAEGRFGYAVADAGDFNNDGWPDLIVGAPYDDQLGQEAGRAFLWFGGPHMAAAPDLVFDDGSGFDHFGWSVAGVGDVNDDGIDDVAVGAPDDDPNGSASGAVYVYFGGTNPNATFDLKVGGLDADDRFGFSVTKAGDLNRDGRDDFAVGAPFADFAGTDVGSVYLFLGANGTPSTSAALRWDGEAGGSSGPGGLNGPGFGWSVSDVTGFKGDGRSALIVGAPGYASSTGRAYLYFDANFANTLPSGSPGVTFTNATSGQEFGYAVSQAGTVDGDSRMDLVIGAPGAFGETGFAKVYYGATSPSTTIASSAANLTRNGETSGDRFGHSVCDVGDFDGTGGGDWAVGAPNRDESGLEAGRVYLFNGTVSTPADQPARNLFQSGFSGDHWGFSVCGAAGDLDGDGDDDLLIGSPDANGSTNAVLGVIAMVGSGTGVVPVPRLDVNWASVDARELRVEFRGAVLGASDASLWTVDTSPREVAAVGDGLHWETDALVATLATESVRDERSLELRWSVDGGATQTASFQLPSLPRGLLALHEPSPNPFNPATRISYELPEATRYRLVVFDARGRLVRELATGHAAAGAYSLTFDGRDGTGRVLASGVYRLMLEASGRVRSTHLLLLK